MIVSNFDATRPSASTSMWVFSRLDIVFFSVGANPRTGLPWRMLILARRDHIEEAGDGVATARPVSSDSIAVIDLPIYRATQSNRPSRVFVSIEGYKIGVLEYTSKHARALQREQKNNFWSKSIDMT